MAEYTDVEKNAISHRGLAFRAMVPNAITLLALCFGLTGVAFAIGGEWEKALGAVVFAGVLDGLDGRIARIVNATHVEGAEKLLQLTLDLGLDATGKPTADKTCAYTETARSWKTCTTAGCQPRSSESSASNAATRENTV